MPSAWRWASRCKTCGAWWAQAARLASAGVLLGAALAAALATLLHGLVVGVAAVDPVSNGAAAALFAGVLAVACRRLTTRAATTDPAVALHAQ